MQFIELQLIPGRQNAELLAQQTVSIVTVSRASEVGSGRCSRAVQVAPNSET